MSKHKKVTRIKNQTQSEKEFLSILDKRILNLIDDLIAANDAFEVIFDWLNDHPDRWNDLDFRLSFPRITFPLVDDCAIQAGVLRDIVEIRLADKQVAFSKHK